MEKESVEIKTEVINLPVIITYIMWVMIMCLFIIGGAKVLGGVL